MRSIDIFSYLVLYSILSLTKTKRFFFILCSQLIVNNAMKIIICRILKTLKDYRRVKDRGYELVNWQIYLWSFIVSFLKSLIIWKFALMNHWLTIGFQTISEMWLFRSLGIWNNTLSKTPVRVKKQEVINILHNCNSAGWVRTCQPLVVNWEEWGKGGARIWINWFR